MGPLAAQQLEEQQGEKKMAKVKKPKRVPVAEQYSNLQTMCRNVVAQLKRKGIEVP